MSKQTNWRVYERNHIYPQSLTAYLDLMYLGPSRKYPYIANHNNVMTYVNGYVWWARDYEAMEKTARRWIKNWLTTKEFKNFLQLFNNLENKTKNVLPTLKKIAVKNISDEALYRLYERVKNIYLSGVVFNEYGVDLFDDFFSKIFTEKLQELTKDRIIQIDTFKLLSPASITESLKYQKRILELSLSEKVSPEILAKVRQQFDWIAMSWDGSNQLTIGQLKNDLYKLKKKSVHDRQKELVKIKNFSRVIKTERIKILKKYRISPIKLKPYFYLLDIFVVLHDRRKKNQMYSNQIIFQTLKEMAKRFKVNYSDLLFYKNLEIKSLCLDKIRVSKGLIAKRKKGLTFVFKEGKVKEYLGSEAKKVLDKLVLSQVKVYKTSQVTGVPASSGKVIGQAFVVKGAKEALKVLKKGGILVTSMTTIDYLPAMHKAAAIVTDDGGITCHAAIVSRELGIPSVVGTKVATQVFRTGDRVEVDADTGIVRKI